ncbi:MAG: ribose 5-phosphate isomerase B [Armatimonadetes bacterium]|nr:ribose 5-phosphate isomerase B [Armatimonadota bacterium]MBS1700524.1 ribose 5-phosphate isomerase B [Armatimonadota bacterium]MBS1728991.1 ribose 5-phosphate isomerase B [Armatimonadota bacterium]
MKIVLGSDHAGIELRRWLVSHLRADGHECTEVGAPDESSYDYPDASDELAKVLNSTDTDYGIIICGTGIGVSIRANRYPYLRCALCTTEYMASMAREHNDANVLALGARVLGTEQALAIVKTFIATKASEIPRHQARVRKLSAPI